LPGLNLRRCIGYWLPYVILLFCLLQQRLPTSSCHVHKSSTGTVKQCNERQKTSHNRHCNEHSAQPLSDCATSCCVTPCTDTLGAWFLIGWPVYPVVKVDINRDRILTDENTQTLEISLHIAICKLKISLLRRCDLTTHK